MRQQREPFEKKFMCIVFDHSWRFGKKIGWRRDRNLVMIQFFQIVRVGLAFMRLLFAWIDAMPDSGAT